MPRAKIMKPAEALDVIGEMGGETTRDTLIFLCGCFAAIKDSGSGPVAWKIFTGALGKAPLREEKDAGK